ncbi:chitin disaccharide deacetylase [Enterococcus sp. LJL51]|uniref:chitin disaccharide deacetylase n=1 Tax=Enterococcus sp. LJL51 TaxID=3416656 RepID=UPI003CF05B9C
MKLLINADDFGLSRGQNYGIIDCFKKGVVASTTLLSTTQAFEHACQLAKQHRTLDIGVHLSLDLGQPVLDSHMIPSLVSQPQTFKRYNLEANELDVSEEEVYKEWRAQIEKVYAHGLTPSHIDSHHHIHMMTNIFPVYTQLAKEFQLAVRFHPRKWSDEQIQAYQPLLDGLPHADYFLNSFYLTSITPEFFANLQLEENQIYEMMCHPAYVDQWIFENSSYNIQRSLEAETLQSERTKAYIKEKQIELINFEQLCNLKG